jgi:hypothetical protein
MSFGQSRPRVLIAVAFVVLVNASTASAVCVTDGQGPCYRFWKVDAVFVAKVIAKERHRSGDPFGGNYQLQVIVAEAFRGVAIGERVTLFAPDGVCGGVNAADGGELFIYASRNKDDELWAQGCGDSGPLEDADADLAYARSVNEHGPAALVYGDVYQIDDRYDDERQFTPMSGVLLRVVGKNFAAEAFSDEEGNYAIILPGSGAYTIEALPPDGFAERFAGVTRFDIADRRSCYRAPFQLQRNGRIRGRVIDAQGQPIPHLVVETGDSEHFGKTDESGAFDIGPLSEGWYIIAALTGANRKLTFEDSKPVKIQHGQIAELKPLTAVATNDLVTLAIVVRGADAGDVFVQVISEASGQALGLPVLAGPEPIHVLVARDRSFEILAVSMTHEAKTVARSKAPETTITLTPRRQRPQ